MTTVANMHVSQCRAAVTIASARHWPGMAALYVMRKRPIVVTIGALALGLLAILAAELTRSQPTLLRISETSLPGCATRTLSITPTGLSLTDVNGILTQVRLNSGSSQALMRAISNAHAATLDSLYEDHSVDDGFELSFQFNISDTPKTVTVRNRYVPSLYAILDECDTLLPQKRRLSRTQYFVEQNLFLNGLIGRHKRDLSWPEEFRAKVIAELERKRVKIDE